MIRQDAAIIRWAQNDSLEIAAAMGGKLSALPLILEPSGGRFLRNRTASVLRLGKRSGVSPVISTTILLAITITMGLSLWGFVNSASSSSAESFTNEITDYVNYVNERYVIVNLAFGYDNPDVNACSDDSDCVTLWIYNYSERDVRVEKVLFGESSASQQEVKLANSAGEDILKANTLGSIVFDISDHPDHINFNHDGSTYYATVVTSGGSTQVYYQTDK